MRFIPNTPQDREKILKELGINSVEELFEHIPKSLRLKKGLSFSEGISELELKKEIKKISNVNSSTEEFISFLGGGMYDHYIPAIVDYVCLRPEFYTAYTPYQAEASQGTLQIIYEYQSMVAHLMGMEVANASLYDGATALVEACIMAEKINPKGKIIITEGVHPTYIRCVETYLGGVEKVPLTKEGKTDIDKLKSSVSSSFTVFVIQQPNFYGILEDIEEIEKIVHSYGGLYVGITLPISLGILSPPGEWGADIAIADGQTLGLHQTMGGPTLGIFASKKKWIRLFPGRIIAKTKDREGKVGYVMTLQAREQHIRREKATSNICTNEGLCAIGACVYLTIMGREGLKEVGVQCYSKAQYLAKEIQKIDNFKLVYSGKFFNEFLIRTPVPAETIVNTLLRDKIFAGIPLSRFYKKRKYELLIAVTEKRSKEEMDYFVEKLKRRW
jgi:glycine dehydrogenase subunit 1